MTLTPIPVLLLFGPTASGKTEILEKLFTGDRFSGEVVSADSMQVYRGMDIGTAKPSPDLLARLPHHLIDILNPNEQFNVGEFVRLADCACQDIAHRGKLPVVSGGTGFYLRNFVLGLSEAPPSDLLIRQTLAKELETRGAPSLMEDLAACDPVSAARIHINDHYRLLRALEVFRTTGRPLSSYAQSGAVSEFAGASEAPARPSYRFLILGLDRPRAEVYRRINERCALMFQHGLPEEVRRLHEAGYGPGDPGMKAIGYQEFFVKDDPGTWQLSKDLGVVETLVARNSRHYAKRQYTFFASIPNVKWISMADDPVGDIRRELKNIGYEVTTSF
ncbi:tRNA isopentenyltransferase [Treponema primitia ZAS-2]|uniref:tRNA dimethylallyltransferase n=1 Tax=Treponema primitia (strain ATCC BAA-887 / DSM 12427 / ZAS-2) TaxID=545694 RepID=F5YGP6_TREPZ|nr:tRNA (adenosine(37)-N6)-dimethylallyltransferase MiaA [Treponema primitia]AEF85255.1 tRNA isopentenyltransferase [Treponema primitia ZAS-2]